MRDGWEALALTLAPALALAPTLALAPSPSPIALALALAPTLALALALALAPTPTRRDCLHYCLPGPSDAWALALYNLLLNNPRFEREGEG